MSDEVHALENASKLGAIDERTRNTDERVKSIEHKLDEMVKAFVPRSEFFVWKSAVFALFAFATAALLYSIFSGTIHFGK